MTIRSVLRRRLVPASLLTAAALVLAACSGGTSSDATSTEGSTTAVSGGSLTWAIASEPSCFAPAFHQLVSDRAVLRNLFDSLVHQEDDGTFTGWLADSWVVSDDGTTYTFTLGEGITFSDGATLDAEAVKENYDYVRDSANGSTYSTLLSSVSEITAPDATTLVLQLSAPDTSLLDSLSSVALGIVDPAGLDLGDGLCDPTTGDLSGSGPFTVADYSRGDHVELARNDDYDWAPETADHTGAAYLDTVTYSFQSDDSGRVGSLESGQVDAISGVPALQVETLEGQGLTYQNGPSTSSTFGFVINADAANAPWDDVRLRQAVRDGFDLDAIVQAVYSGQVDRAWSWFGQDSAGYDASLEGAWGDDVDAANALLDEAGWTEVDDEGYRTKDGERLTLEVTYDADSVRDQRDTLIEAVQDQLKTNLGVELAFSTPTWTEVSAAIADGSWSVYPATFGRTDYANSVLGTWSGYFYAAGSYQPTAAVDAATTALTATDDATRTEALAAIQTDLVLDEAVFIPLTESTFQVAYASDVHGIGFDASSGTPDSAYDVWLG
ncbi:MAG TPA: ABC transporter substrate-binding protein [Cellulomonas sp.]